MTTDIQTILLFAICLLLFAQAIFIKGDTPDKCKFCIHRWECRGECMEEKK